MKNKFNKIKKKIYPSKSFVGLLLSIIILISPIINHKYTKGHDSYFHMTNMLHTNEYISISNLKLSLPKVFGGNIANGFGYGTGIFYPPLSYYLTSYIVNILNLDKTNKLLSLPIAEMIIIALSGISMYYFLKKTCKDNKIAGIGSISYISSTYFLCDIYVRGAISEALTFIFIPLIFLSLYELFLGNEKKFYTPFIIGYVGMICSHLVITMYLTGYIIIIFLINWKKIFKINKIKKLLIASVITLLISSPYWVLLLEHKLYGNYVVFESGSMYTIDSIQKNLLNIKDLFIPRVFNKIGIRIFINPMVSIISLITIIFYKKTFKDKKVIFKILIVLIILTLFMTTKYFPWTKLPSIINLIQFPWRLRIFSTFFLAIISGHIVKILNFKYNNLVIIIIAILIILVGYKTINRYTLYSLDDFLDKYSITDKNIMYDINFNHMGVQKEYRPVNAKNNIEYYENRSNEVIVKEGLAEIQITKDYTPDLNFDIKIISEMVTLELPRLYYLGYNIKYIDSLGREKTIKYHENSNGFIEISLKESGTIKMTYTGTLASNISKYISLVTILIGLTIIIYSKKERKD